MRDLSIHAVVAILILLLATTFVGQESSLDRDRSDTISAGTKLEDAIKTLHNYGYKNETAFSWAKIDPDESHRWFVFDDGVRLAVIYSDSRKTILRMQVVVLPPERSAKGNDRIIGIRSVRFHDDGSYALHVDKQVKQEGVNSAVAAPQLPQYKQERK
jgi:hypothetical protein